MSIVVTPGSLDLDRDGRAGGETSIGLAVGRLGAVTWSTVALAGVMALAGVLYLWNLTVSGFANAYYAAAAQAASQSWTSFFFGSVDAGNFITVDKPPLALWLMGLSVRLFGLSSASVLLPEALLGVATVGLLFIIVRRSFGPVAALIAALVAALTPAAVLMFRYDNPDALLTFLLVASAGALLRAIETGRRRWLVATAVLVGLAFDTKFLQAYLVLPGFALALLVAAAGSWRRRIGDLLLLGVATLIASGWWVAIVELTPSALRPYIGGSTTNSALELLLGYDGLARILGMFGLSPRGPDGGGGGGGGFGGVPGILRMFNDQFAGQIGWLIPMALVGLTAGLWLTRRHPRTDPRRAAYLLWGGWLLVHLAVFSLMSGIIHSYYVVAMAPAIGALVGAGVVELWALRRRARLGGAVLALAFAGSTILAASLLGRTPAFMPGLSVAIIALAVSAGLVIALPAGAVSRRLSAVALSVAVLAILLAPAAYALDTTATAYSGGDPSAGPSMARADTTGLGGAGPLGGGSAFGGRTGTFPGQPPSGLVPGTNGLGGGPGGIGGGGPGGSLDQATIDYLVANRGTTTWLVAVNSANEAAPIQLATGIPVMAMGGFTGSDPAPTLDQLKAYIASGRLRFVMAGGGGGAPGSSGDVASTRDSWVTTACKAVNGTSGLYDCAGAVPIAGS